MFFVLYRNTHNGVFDDFQKISDHFPKFPKIVQNLSEDITNVAKHVAKISEDFRGRPEDVSIINERI